MTLGLLSCVILMGATATSGENQPIVVAVHPLEVVDASEEERKQLRGAFVAAVQELGVLEADERAVKSFLGKRPTGSCQGEEQCLGSLAKNARADKALFATVSIYSPRTVITGRVVDSTGEVLREVSKSFDRDPKKPKVAQAKTAVQQFLGELELGRPQDPPVEPLVAHPDSATTPMMTQGRSGEPLAAASPAEIEKRGPAEAGSSGLRTASYVVGGAAVAAGLGAGAVALVARTDARRLGELLDDQGRIPQESDEGRRLQASLGRKEGLATGLVIGAAALGVTAVVLYLLPPPSSSGSLAFVPVVDANAAGLAVNGSF
jgi:hypothetical protein